MASISPRSPEAWECRRKVRTPVCTPELCPVLQAAHVTPPKKTKNKKQKSRIGGKKENEEAVIFTLRARNEGHHFERLRPDDVGGAIKRRH